MERKSSRPIFFVINWTWKHYFHLTVIHCCMNHVGSWLTLELQDPCCRWFSGRRISAWQQWQRRRSEESGPYVCGDHRVASNHIAVAIPRTREKERQRYSLLDRNLLLIFNYIKMFSVFKLRCMGIYCFADVSSITMALNSITKMSPLIWFFFWGTCKKKKKNYNLTKKHVFT